MSFVALTAVALLRYQLFNIRLVVAQTLIFMLVVFLFLRFFLSSSGFDALANGILLICTSILGLFLSRSIGNEVKARTLVEEQKNELIQTNTRLEELSRQKSEFLSIATHQLRTPLGAINGYTSLVLGNSFGDINEKVRGVLQKVLQSGMLMNGTIEDFLSVSRIDQGRMVYDLSDFDVRKLTAEIYGELKPSAERKELALTYTEYESPLVVHADYGKLKHVISNLVDNAIKYTQTGFVNISFAVNGTKVQIRVSDSGVGIPADEIGKLFDKFVRARGAAGVNISGTGLGLYVAKQMVEAQGGKVWAESAGEGKGSTFIAEMPKV
jgi:signal transduction histidine kinase